MGLKTQPVAVLQESEVHSLLSLQVTVVPWQRPWVQVSPEVQALESSQVLALFVLTQPLARSQTSSVQGLRSSQARSLASLRHWPVRVSQPSRVQATLSSQLVAVPRQEPWLQVSPVVHRSPSLQELVLSV